jgi:ubiquinone/menaquinone biosynthesis C-methylase UbiE
MVGLDLAWNMLTLSRQLNGSRSALLLLQGTATSLPFVGPAFDKVVANSVTHYLSPDQLSLMLTDLGRLLKPGGRIVIGDVEEPSLPFIGRLRRTWDRQGWSGLLRQALKKMIALVWQLYQQERERILATRGRYQPVIKPASIYRYTPDEMIRLGTDAGFQARVVPQGRGTLYPNRFNVVITHKPVTKNQ